MLHLVASSRFVKKKLSILRCAFVVLLNSVESGGDGNGCEKKKRTRKKKLQHDLDCVDF